MDQPDPPETFIAAPEVAKRLGISERNLSRLRSNGGGPPFLKLGRRVLYGENSLAAWIGHKKFHAALDRVNRVLGAPPVRTTVDRDAPGRLPIEDEDGLFLNPHQYALEDQDRAAIQLLADWEATERPTDLEIFEFLERAGLDDYVEAAPAGTDGYDGAWIHDEQSIVCVNTFEDDLDGRFPPGLTVSGRRALTTVIAQLIALAMNNQRRAAERAREVAWEAGAVRP